MKDGLETLHGLTSGRWRCVAKVPRQSRSGGGAIEGLLQVFAQIPFQVIEREGGELNPRRSSARVEYKLGIEMGDDSQNGANV